MHRQLYRHHHFSPGGSDCTRLCVRSIAISESIKQTAGAVMDKTY
jgi:hypothetical protein